MLERVAKAVFRKRLKQVVQRMGLKSLERLAVIGGYKDRHRHGFFADRGQYLEAI